MRREFTRETNRLEATDKKLTRELNEAIKKKTNMVPLAHRRPPSG
jgi:hypothetical protein